VISFAKFIFQKENLTMRSKRSIQILVMFMLVFSTTMGSQPVLASANSAPLGDTMVIDRSLSYWDATYIGFVNSGIHEKWHFDFTESHNFVVTVSPVSGDLVPLLKLLDANDNELASGTGTLTSIQPAGTYAIQVEPVSGGGFYILTLRETVTVLPSVTTSVSPTSVNVGDTAIATVSLNNVPAGGYTSAEFTCTYNAGLVQVSNIVVGNLFGADAAAAINDPQSGSFIVAIAGSNGNKATTSGPVFTFNAEALQGGQTSIECTVRVSKGDNILTGLPSTPANLTIIGSAPTATFTPTPFESPTSEPDGTPTVTSTPVPDSSPTVTSTSEPGGTPTATSTSDPNSTPTETTTSEPGGTPTATSTPDGSSTPVESPTPTATQTSTPDGSPEPTSTSTPVSSPTATPLPDGTVTGQVLAGKPVAVGLYDTGDELVASVAANTDGTFSLTAPAGTYTILAVSSGSLSAQGSVTLVAGNTISQPVITLLAGDIDGNNVIDQFDAITIGINYNASIPTSADLNNDSVINVLDLELLAQNYRETGPLTWE
jgi:hypothetical protein